MDKEPKANLIYEFPNTDYLSDFYKQTLGEDSEHEKEIANREISALFRWGDRTALENSQYVPANESGLNYIGIISKHGSHQKKEPPEFSRRIPIRIASRAVKKISDLGPEDFEGAYANVRDQSSLIDWLNKKYSPKKFNPNFEVTIYRFEYVDEAKS